MKLNGMLSLLDNCIQQLHKRYPFCHHKKLDTKRLDTNYYHFELLWTIQLPQNFLNTYDTKQIDPHIGLDLYLLDEEKCVSIVNYWFSTLSEMLHVVQINYQRYQTDIPGVI